ncbi:MAG TPA: hypothetical protein VGG33_12720 [Polyangia bacterium]
MASTHRSTHRDTSTAFPRLSRCGVAAGLLSLLLASACATQRGTGTTAPARPDVPPATTPPPPAITQESDPDNVERRFGFGEARVRRENAAAAQSGAPANGQPTQQTIVAEPAGAPPSNVSPGSAPPAAGAPPDRAPASGAGGSTGQVTPARATTGRTPAPPPAR